MIQIKNGKFQKNGLAFSPPDGYCFESRPDVEMQDGMVFFSEDGTKMIRYLFLISDEKAGTALHHLFQKDFLGYVPYRLLLPASPIFLGGFVGFYAFYEGEISEDGSATQYFELRIDLTGCDEGFAQFSLRVCDENADIVSFVQTDEFQSIINGISSANETV